MADEGLDIEGNFTQGITDSHSWQGGKGSRTSGNTTYGSDGETKRKLEDKGGGGGGGEGDSGGERSPDQEQQEVSVKKQKITMGFSKSFSMIKPSVEKKGGPMPISIKLGTQKPKEPTPSLTKASASVAEIFNQDSDEEEMPPEARMRMRNIGRDTPTSAGPNSFGKTRQGFCNVKKIFEKTLKTQMDGVTKK